MKLIHINEQEENILPIEKDYSINEIDRNDIEILQVYCGFINANTGQLSIRLTPQKLLYTMGVMGGIYGLYFGSELVGGVAVKQVNFENNVKAGEIGYLFVLPDHRSLKNIRSLYTASLENYRRFDVLYAVTNVKNRPMTVLLKRTPKMVFLFSAKSLYTPNMLNYWLSIYSNKKYSLSERENMVRTEFEDKIED